MTKSISLLAPFVIALGFCACGGGSSGRAGDGGGLDGAAREVSTGGGSDVGGGKQPDASPMTCGGPGFGCCAGNTCNGNGCCVLGVCAAPGTSCGSLGGTCDKGACGGCGSAGQACCATGTGAGTCTAAGTKCQSGICMACGSAGLPCCEGAASNACLGAGLACNGSMCVAVSIPDAGQDAPGGAGGDAARGSADGPVAGAGGATISGSGGAGGTLVGSGGKTGTGGVGGGAGIDAGAGNTGGRDAAADAPITTRDGGDAATASCPAGCSPGQACINGLCTGVVCTPNAKFCQGNQVLTCSAGGDASAVTATCTTSQYCDNASATCKTGLCAPNQPACNGKMATTCNEDGTGYLAGGSDCTANNMRCNVNLGTCQPIICSAGTSYCEAGAVRKCGSDGTTSTLIKTCVPGEFCAEAQCKPTVCTPSTPLCNNGIATTCNDDGSGFAPGGTNCSSIDSVCVEGACKKRICSPNSMFCDTAKNAILRCTEDGLSATLNSGCEYSQFCDPAKVECTDLECIPNQPACDDLVATTCNALGSGYVAGGENCLKKGLNCRLGVCVAESCVVGKYFCDEANSAVYMCPDNAGTTRLIDRCDPSYQFCDPVKAACTTMLCKPGEPACHDDVLSTCKADGSGAEAGGTDCTTSGQMCIAGACVSQSIESVGQRYASGDTSGTNLAVLNTYAVSKSRTLVAIEQAMSVSARTITFLVFDCGTSPSEGGSGMVATTCTAIESLVSNVEASSPYVLSGAMSVPLVAGRKYMIGAWWSTKATYHIDHYSAASHLTTSFATLEGAADISATTAPTTVAYEKHTTSRYPQKLHIAP